MKQVSLFVASLMLSVIALAQPARQQAARFHQQHRAGAVRQQPAGKLYENLIVKYTGEAYSNWMGKYDSSSECACASVVEGTDGNLYILNLAPVLSLTEEYWVKAEKQTDGSYLIQKQPIGTYTSEFTQTSTEYYITLMQRKGETMEESESASFGVIWSDGTLRLAAGVDADHPFGIVSQAKDKDSGLMTWQWNGSAYWDYVATEQKDVCITPPADAEKVKYILTTHNDGEEEQEMVDVAFAGEDIYLNLRDEVPGWVKGTLHGNKLNVKGGQYMGVDEYYGMHIYEHVCETSLKQIEMGDDILQFTEYGDALPEINMDFDAATRTISTSYAITFDGARDSILEGETFVAPSLAVFKEVPACPADPQITMFYNFDEEEGYAAVGFVIPTKDIAGNYILSEKLSYLVYLDSETEPYVFKPDTYETLDAPMTEIAYDFDDDYDFTVYEGEKEVYFYFPLSKCAGVQAIYRGGGEEHRSNIVLYDLVEKKMRTIPVDDPIRTRISLPKSDAEVVGTEYRDLSGRRVSGDARGLLIRIQRLADGSLRTSKVRR